MFYLFRKQAKEAEKERLDVEIKTLSAGVKEHERSRESLRIQVKEIKAVENQISQLRVQITRSEASKKSMINQSDNYDKDKENIINKNKVCK